MSSRGYWTPRAPTISGTCSSGSSSRNSIGAAQAEEAFTHGPYLVRQEVNTSGAEDGPDIADLVLESDQERLVIENYFTSDGHGHDYGSYSKFAERGVQRGVVVLLCRDEDSSRLIGGWEEASVVTYDKVVRELRQKIASDYPQKHPEAYSFIDQMYRKFVKGRGRMEDHEVLEFLTVMCSTGEARRYREQSQEAAARKFADDVANQAVERFGEGRELLQRVKGRLKTYCSRVLQAQLNDTMSAGFVTEVSATYAGIYQWTVNLKVADEGDDIGEAKLQLKFGPSAWFANEEDPVLATHCGSRGRRLLPPLSDEGKVQGDPAIGRDTAGSA